MPKIDYAKEYLSVSDQVRLLQGRGMVISDPDRATACLHRIGYYRLSGYAYPFRHREVIRNGDGTEDERIFENYRPHTEFAQVMDLYVFDKKLRLLFLDAIERVEVGLRVEIALLLGQRGAFSYRAAANFNAYFSAVDSPTGETPHQRLLTKLDNAFERSREEFAEHYRTKYRSPLPIWMSIELWDFGTLSTIVSGMQTADLNQLAALYKLPRRGLLQSWAQSINFIRNVCAHHGRLWNRPLVQQPSPGRRGEITFFEHLVDDTHAQRRLYAAAAVLQYLMKYIHPSSTWAARLQDHLQTFPDSPHISRRHMGFPDGWAENELWRFRS
jgi:abortive infection bacteriophage resistance protein